MLVLQDCRGASESDYLDFSDLNDFQFNEYGGEIGSNFASQGLDEFFIRQELINYLMADEPRYTCVWVCVWVGVCLRACVRA